MTVSHRHGRPALNDLDYERRPAFSGPPFDTFFHTQLFATCLVVA